MQRGLTLIELMISLTVGLMILLALSMVFLNSSTSRRELELSAEAMENGRYAVDVLSRELAQTGFYGPLGQVAGAAMAASDVCGAPLATIANSLATHVMGFQSGAYPACIAANVKPGTQVIYLQRASTCVVGESGCAAEDATRPYIQVAECGFEYSVMPFVVAAGLAGTGTFKLQSKPCNGTGLSSRRALLRRLYYVNSANVLEYQDLLLPGTAAPAPVTVVEGIDDLRVEFAVDANRNGSIDASEFEDTPADWTRVIGLRVGLLSVSTQPGKVIGDARTFDLAGSSVNRPADGFKRRAYNTVIMFETPTLRDQS